MDKISREQVAGCKYCHEEWGTCDPITNRFTMLPGKIRFCPMCGKPLDKEESFDNARSDKIKTPFAQIIVEGHQKSPHYSILYYSPDDKDFRIGYGSYCLDYVFEWLRDEFEIMEDESFSLLFPHTREQVEKVWRGEWEEERFAGELEGWQHTECGRHSTEKSMWCPKCGKAMTDEAVDLIMRRLEALQDADD